MPKRSIESRSQELLALAPELANTSGLTWVEANNAIYGLGGPFARLFPNVLELSCPSVRFNARVGAGTEDACLWIDGDGRART